MNDIDFKNQMNIKYSDLPEDMKPSDRDKAREIEIETRRALKRKGDSFLLVGILCGISVICHLVSIACFMYQVYGVGA